MRYFALIVLLAGVAIAEQPEVYPPNMTGYWGDGLAIDSSSADTVDTLWGAWTGVIADTTYWGSLPKSDSLVIFYVDTVAWKQVTETVPAPCPNNYPGCLVMHWKTITKWVPITETTVVATYPIESKVKRERWQWKIR